MEDNQIQNLWNEYKELLLSTKRPNIEKLIQWLDESDFKTAPASTIYHSSYRGGLLQHSLNVYYAMYDFPHWIEFFDLADDTIKITALLHDICKVNCYDVSVRNTKNENGDWVQVPYYSWNELEPLGHGAKSVMKIYEYGVQLSGVERAMILNHMGLSGTDDDRRISKLFRVCPQSLLLHFADMEASNIFESYDGPQRYIDKISGKNIRDSLVKLKYPEAETVTILGVEYKLAPNNAIVDDEKIIEINYEGKKIKVYSPYGDGLPF